LFSISNQRKSLTGFLTRIIHKIGFQFLVSKKNEVSGSIFSRGFCFQSLFLISFWIF